MVKLWSIWVRLFHWALAIGFTWEFFNDSGGTWHDWVGYSLALLIVLRVIYGVTTSNFHERWERFRVSPTQFFTSIKEILSHKMNRSLGHPPQAAFVMVAILIFILLTVVTGHMLGIYYFFGEDWAEEVHEYLAWTTVALIVAHILGVFHASWTWKENLTASMIHGKRRKLSKKDELT